MANIIRIKRRATGGAPGAPTTLFSGELAYNENDSTLYIGIGTSGAGGTATIIPAIAGPGAYVSLVTAQTISGAKTFSGAVALGEQATAATPVTSDSSTAVATTAFVKAQNYLTGNQSIALSGDVSGSGTTSISVTIADGVVSNSKLANMTADTLKGRRSTTGQPEDLTAAQVKTLLAITPADVSGFDAQVKLARLDELALPTSNVRMNSVRIINLEDPVSAQDAATKAYVDASRQGLDVKASVRVATTEPIMLLGTQTIDGVAVAVGDRVLVKNQTIASNNGIYVVAENGWSRATDANSSSNITPGLFTFVEAGDTNADSGFVLTTDSAVVIGTTPLTFVQFSGAGQVVAGGGLEKVGNTLNIVSADVERIVINADSIDLATTGVDPDSYTLVSVDAYGRVTGGLNPTTLAGYGITDAQPAITANGILKSDGSGTVNAAVANTDYQSVITATGLLKGAGSGSVSAATAGTDYLSPDSTIDGGVF